MIYTYTDSPYLRIGDGAFRTGVQSRRPGEDFRPRIARAWGTWRKLGAQTSRAMGDPRRFSTSKSLPGRVTWGKRDGGHDFFCAL